MNHICICTMGLGLIGAYRTIYGEKNCVILIDEWHTDKVFRKLATLSIPVVLSGKGILGLFLRKGWQRRDGLEWRWPSMDGNWQNWIRECPNYLLDKIWLTWSTGRRASTNFCSRLGRRCCVWRGGAVSHRCGPWNRLYRASRFFQKLCEGITRLGCRSSELLLGLLCFTAKKCEYSIRDVEHPVLTCFSLHGVRGLQLRWVGTIFYHTRSKFNGQNMHMTMPTELRHNRSW